MASIVFNDLDVNSELDQAAQVNILGGDSCHHRRRHSHYRFYRVRYRGRSQLWSGGMLMRYAHNRGYNGGGVRTWYRRHYGFDPFARG